jgi:polysaccharide biosynthesis protein PslH
MKILIISMSFPYPPKSGGKVRVFNLIKEISKYHEVYLLSLISTDELGFVPMMLKYCKKVEVIPFEHNSLSKLIRWIRIFSNLFTQTPLEVAAKESTDMKKKVKKIIINNGFDLIQVEWLQMAHYLPFDLLKNTPLILVEHDVAYVPLKRRSLTETGILKYIMRRECFKMKIYEQKICHKFNKIISMSEIDKGRLLKLNENLDVCVIPNGVDTKYISPKVDQENTGNLLFIGWLKHYPNRDGMIFFLKEIFPLITKEIPNTTIYIVGQYAPQEIITLSKSNPNIICTGYVEDVREYLHKCTVYVCPLRIGGGTRLKILEAMAAGIPIVSTTIGAEGLSVKHGENILLSDSADTFAKETINLLNNPELRLKLAKKARNFVEENYGWEMIAQKQMAVYDISVKNEDRTDY